jgi:hypothetical protein
MNRELSFSFREIGRQRDASHSSGREASPAALARYGKQRLRLALGPFRRRVRHVEAILRDVNGPRGGMDKSCTVRIHLEPSDLLVVEGHSDSPYAAIAEATRRAGAAVRRRLHRRRALARTRHARALALA